MGGRELKKLWGERKLQKRGTRSKKQCDHRSRGRDKSSRREGPVSSEAGCPVGKCHEDGDEKMGKKKVTGMGTPTKEIRGKSHLKI